MTRGKSSLIVGLAALIMANCTMQMKPKEYMRYYESHRKLFSSTANRNGVSATVTYTPSEYYAAREMANNPELSIDSAMKKYGNALYFTLTIASDSPNAGSVLLSRDGREGFSENVFKNTFGRDRDIFLHCGGDTVKTVNCEYERNWGVGNQDVFLVSFPRSGARSALRRYHIEVRDIVPELGTVDVALKKIMKNPKLLKG